MNTSLYIHIPFCISKCKYCDFNSMAIGELGEEALGKKISDYVNSLVKEIESYGNKLRTDDKNYAVIDTVFFGGGTPSLLSGDDFSLIMDVIGENFKISANCEITMEMNPDTVNETNMKAYKSKGLNRVSMGAQSFDDGILTGLGRIHDSEKIRRAFKIIRSAGIDNISIDLMVGLSGQNMQSIENDLKNIEILSPEHLSVYMLQLEEGTEYERLENIGKIKLPEEDDVMLMFDRICEILSDKGYNRYEISNFSKMGFESRHNMVYWRNKEYIGVGVGAHGYINDIRYENTEKLMDYILRVNSGSNILIDQTFVDVEEKMFNEVMLGLRLTQGIDMVDFTQKYNVDFEKYYKLGINSLIKDELAIFDSSSEGRFFKLTKKGLDIQNYCLEELLL